jgi:hypothetical protein
VHQHLRRLQADALDLGQQQDQGVRSGRVALDRLRDIPLDGLDLLADQAAALQQAVQLGQCVGRQRLTLNRAQGFQVLRRLLQARLEALEAPQRQFRLIVLVTRVRSATSPSRSRPGRLASSWATVGIATIRQCPGSPRSQPSSARISISVSSRSVLARRCSRDTATLLA